MPLVYLDTNVFIQAFESRLEIAGTARQVFEILDTGPAAAVTSELTSAELLAPSKAPGRLNVAEKINLYEAVLDRSSIVLMPVSRAVLRETALLRQSFVQKLPDAIHVVTSLQSGCRYLMSSDKDTKRLPLSIERILPDQAGVATIQKALRG